MGTDDEGGCGGFKSHTALDADDGVAHVHVAANAVGCADFLYLADGGHGVVVASAVHGFQFAVLKGEAQFLGACFLHLLEVGAFGQALCGVKNFAAADAGAPDAHVVGVF